jgi:hypothetical protein
MIFESHYRAIENEFGIQAEEIIGDDDQWVAKLSDGQVIKSDDFDAAKIKSASKELEKEKAAEAEAKATAKDAVLAQLGITEEQAKLLLA